MAYGVLPKEKKEALVVLWIATLNHYVKEGVNLRTFLHQVHGDEGLGGQAALKEVIPEVQFVVGARHKLRSIVKSKHGSKNTRLWVVSQLQFALSALSFSELLFHLHVEAIMSRWIENAEVDLAEYLQKEVFFQNEHGVFTAFCRNNVSLIKKSVDFRTYAVPGSDIV